MAKVTARASKDVAAPPDRIVAFLHDYPSRPKIFTQNYSNFRLDDDGEATVIAYHFTAGGRERDYRLRVQDADGGLLERDELSSFQTKWTVAPAGAGSSVTIESSWDGAGGIPGFFEGVFAPLGLRRIYGEVLDKLATAVAA